MDPKDISTFLAPPKLTVRETLVMVIGAAIALLLVAAVTSVYHRDYRQGVSCALLAVVLGLVFFWKRRLILVVSMLSTILALGSLAFPFHPSLAGLVLLFGCAVGLYFTVIWSEKKYPYLSFRNMHTLFEGEAAMAAENARIEAEARELVNERSFGPWLFR
jgi:hypothetical protein